ncbi:methionyl-tRNA formyltransferase [Haloplasma contractile]|uniref:Methionyl-tRNA formyltransferase n=1 Tax=Haloplasma contractile SSD-17B TaxID=1033810 RepID=U2EEM4_9MOLU|nr:methionyl-tRNA formyltransferase [Haloplasma contractile]ERJ13418.1 Methionyl-tRNA formyltransferase protein [Haloplasma contractile SSD-17B]
MRVVFMGTPDFSVPILKGLIDSEYKVVGVVTQPDRKVGRKRILTPPPVKQLATEYNLEVFQPEKIKQDYSRILEWNPDLIITAAYGQIVPTEILEAPKFGAINVHASLLPKYRGGAPIHQSIIDGCKETGITIMYMVDRMDAGDILKQESVEIEFTDHVGTLHDKLSLLGRDLLLRTLPDIFNHEIKPTKQNEEEVTYAWNIKREDERINWNSKGIEIYNQIRGLNPWPVAYTKYHGKNVKVWTAEPVRLIHNQEPGTILKIESDGIVVTSKDADCIKVTELQLAGKKKQLVKEILNGNHEFIEKEQFE